MRVDSGFTSGDEITIHYDPLIAKMIVWAEDRPAAIRRMQAALRETVLLGLTNNGQFLQDVLATPDFQAGDVYTTWVEEHFGDWQPPQLRAAARGAGRRRAGPVPAGWLEAPAESGSRIHTVPGGGDQGISAWERNGLQFDRRAGQSSTRRLRENR